MKRRPARAKMIAELFETFMAILHSASHRSRLQVADQQHRRARRGYDGRIVRLEGQLYVVRGFGCVVDIRTEEDSGDQPTLRHPRPHAAT